MVNPGISKRWRGNRVLFVCSLSSPLLQLKVVPACNHILSVTGRLFFSEELDWHVLRFLNYPPPLLRLFLCEYASASLWTDVTLWVLTTHLHQGKAVLSISHGKFMNINLKCDELCFFFLLQSTYLMIKANLGQNIQIFFKENTNNFTHHETPFQKGAAKHRETRIDRNLDEMLPKFDQLFKVVVHSQIKPPNCKQAAQTLDWKWPPPQHPPLSRGQEGGYDNLCMLHRRTDAVERQP